MVSGCADYYFIGIGLSLNASRKVRGLTQCQDLAFFTATDFANDD